MVFPHRFMPLRFFLFQEGLLFPYVCWLRFGGSFGGIVGGGSIFVDETGIGRGGI
jgi:hypothetical protein